MQKKRTAATSPGDAEVVKAFLDNLALERGIAVNTRAGYARDLTLLSAALRERNRSLLDAQPDDLVRFLENATAAGEAPRTRARRAAAIRGFYRFACAESLCATDPGALLPSPRMPKLLPKALSREDMEQLLRTDHRSDEAPAGRDALLLELLYGCGLRASEAANLRCADFDLEGGFVRVTGKGGKARAIPISASIRSALASWLQGGRKTVLTAESGDALLLSNGGRSISRGDVYTAIKNCVRRAGLRSSITPHTLRHTFATHLVKGGADLRAVQEMLGHASIDTTQIYTTLAEEHLHAAHRRFHPRG